MRFFLLIEFVYVMKKNLGQIHLFRPPLAPPRSALPLALARTQEGLGGVLFI